MEYFPKNRLMQMIADRVIPLGMQCFTGNPALIEVLGLTGFDWVMIDTEHAGNDGHALESLLRTAKLAGLVPVVRVADRYNETQIRRALEAGAEGIMLPMVRSAADVDFAVESAFFPPKGTRGICPAIRAANYNFRSFEEYVQWNNAETILIPMVEHPEAVDHIEEICAHQDVHILVFGAGDLCYAMGEGTLMMKSPKVQTAYRKVLDAAKRHNVIVMGGPVLDPNAAACRKAIEDGIGIFCLGLDTMGFRRFCEQTVNEVSRGVEGTNFSRPPVPASGFPDR